MPGKVLEQGWWVQGITTCRGVVLATAQMVGFLPTERPKNLAVEFAWGAAGFVEVGARKIPPETLLGALEAAPSAEAEAERLRSQLAGVLWRPGEATVLAKKILLRPSRRGLWFLRGKESIRLSRAVPVDEIAQLRAGSLASWTWQP